MEIMPFSDYIKDVNDALVNINVNQLNTFIQILEESFHSQKMIHIFGNGGSGAAASHFCEDLGKGTITDMDRKERFRVMSLTDNTPYILAWGNDNGYETIFEQQLRNFAEAGDVAIGISGSGNSPNVLNAIEYGNTIGMKTVGITGYDGGKLGGLSQHQLHVASFDMGLVESIHAAIMHYIVTVLRERLK